MEVYAAVKHKDLHLTDLILSTVILLAAFGISLLLQRIHPSESLVSLVFVLAVFLISLLTRTYLWGVIASLSSVLVNNFVSDPITSLKGLIIIAICVPAYYGFRKLNGGKEYDTDLIDNEE